MWPPRYRKNVSTTKALIIKALEIKNRSVGLHGTLNAKYKPGNIGWRGPFFS
jgi:hypothetical protein